MPGRHRKPSRRRTTGRHRKPPQRPTWAVPTAAAVASVGFGGVAAATVLSGGSNPATASPPRPSAAVTPRPTYSASALPRATGPAVPRPVTRVAAVHISRPVLVLTATGPIAWVEVTAPGQHLLFEGLLRHGRTLRFTAHPLSVLLGDASAVRVVVRGHARQLAGGHGQVLVLHVS